MNKQMRIVLILLFLLTSLPTLSSLAAESRIYTIKPGDTLWGISERFIEDPNYWPTLWSNNPAITNPHLIYPGQKVRLYDGRIEFIPEYPGAQNTPAPAVVAEEPAPAPVVAAPPARVVETPAIAPESEKAVELFRAAAGGEGFIRTSENSLGTLVDSVDLRVLLTKNDQVFLSMKNLEQVVVGDTYSLYSAGPEITHPVTKKDFGTMMYELGYVQVTAINGKTVIARIGEVYREIERGAELFEYVEPTREIELKKASEGLNGVIVSGQQDKMTQGQNDLIYIDLGEESGLQTGNILYVSRPRQATALAGKEKDQLQLPDDLLGAALVVKTRNQSATALVFKSTAEITVGDHVMAATE